MISGDQPSLTDPKERKRKRERDRYAKLSNHETKKIIVLYKSIILLSVATHGHYINIF